MRIRQITRITILLLWAATTSNLIWALTPTSSMVLPLTPGEQAARLRGIAGAEVARKLYPISVETIEPKFYYQRNYHLLWIKATPHEKTLLAEKIGLQGAARFAAERGWIKILGSRYHAIQQGPDTVYWDKHSGRLHVLEAKGGTAKPIKAFNSLQGTNKNAIRSARFVLRSLKATLMEKHAAALVIVAAQQGRLVTGVINTPHKLGTPDTPKLAGNWDYDYVGREASTIEQKLIRNKPEVRSVFRHAHMKQSFAMLKYRAPQGLAIVGFAGAMILGWDAYQQSLTAWSMFNDPILKGSVLPYMQTGVLFGRMTQATTLAVISNTQLGILGLSKGGVNKFAGRMFLPVTLGVEGLQFATAYHEYNLGRISQRDFYRRTTGPLIIAAFTVGGGIVGGIVGMQAGGITAIPGAISGANIGVIVAIPFYLIADHILKWHYQEFDEQQRLIVNAAVEKHYGRGAGF